MIDAKSIYEAICIIAKNREGWNTLRSSVKSGCITGVGSLVGCAFLGPIGLFFGLSVSSVAAYLAMRGSFKSIIKVIEEDFSTDDKRELIERVRKVINQFNIKDCVLLLNIATNRINFKGQFQETVFKEILNFIKERAQEQIAN